MSFQRLNICPEKPAAREIAPVKTPRHNPPRVIAPGQLFVTMRGVLPVEKLRRGDHVLVGTERVREVLRVTADGAEPPCETFDDFDAAEAFQTYSRFAGTRHNRLPRDPEAYYLVLGHVTIRPRGDAGDTVPPVEARASDSVEIAGKAGDGEKRPADPFPLSSVLTTMPEAYACVREDVSSASASDVDKDAKCKSDEAATPEGVARIPAFHTVRTATETDHDPQEPAYMTNLFHDIDDVPASDAPEFRTARLAVA